MSPCCTRRQAIQISIQSGLGLFAGGFFSSLGAVTVEVNPGMSPSTIFSILAALKPGDTCVWRGGIYAFELMNVIPGGTSWSAPVTLRAAAGEKPIIKPNSGARCISIVDSSHSYIIIDGFVLDADNVSYDAFKVTWSSNPSTAAHHVRLMNSEVKNAYGNGILTTDAHYCEFIRNDIHHNGHSNQEHGLYLASSYSLVEENLMHDNYMGGVHCYRDGGGLKNNIIRRNRTWHNFNPASPTPGNNADFMVGSGSGHQVIDNDSSDNPVGGMVIEYGSSDVMVQGNSVSNIRGVGLKVGPAAIRTTVKNNYVCSSAIPYQNTGSGTIDGGGNSFTSGACSGGAPPPPPINVDVTQIPVVTQPPTSSVSPITSYSPGPTTAGVSAPFLIAGVIGAALLLGGD